MKKILQDILPKNEEKISLKKETGIILNKFKSLKTVNFIVGGSYAKGTWLKGNKEVDIFARFNYEKYKDKDISKELKKLLTNRSIDFKLVHGSRDYFHFIKNDILFEIIPVLDIDTYLKARNVTDVSPLHVSYVCKNSNLNLKNEIRLLKQFCKANDMYGAESYIKGFSGYVIEVLIIYYGSFKKVLNSAKSWKVKEIIDPARHYTTDSEIMLNLTDSKKSSPLIIIDPVQKNRNIAAALSGRIFNKFIKTSKKYNSSDIFFTKKEVVLEKLQGYNIFKITPLDGKKDVVGAKLLKALEKIKKGLEMEGFKVYDYGWKWNNYAYFWFKTNPSLSKIKKHFGPYRKMKKYVDNFKKKWKGKRVYYEGNRIYVNLQRKNTSSQDIIKKLFKRDDIKSNFRYQKIYKQV